MLSGVIRKLGGEYRSDPGRASYDLEGCYQSFDVGSVEVGLNLRSIMNERGMLADIG